MPAKSRALELPSKVPGQLWDRYWNRLSPSEQRFLNGAKVEITVNTADGPRKKQIQLIEAGQPSPRFLQLRGSNEFVHQLWLLFDQKAATKLAKVSPKLLTSEDDRKRCFGEALAAGDLAESNLCTSRPNEILDSFEDELAEATGISDPRLLAKIRVWHEGRVEEAGFTLAMKWVRQIMGFLLGHSNHLIAIGAVAKVFDLLRCNGFSSERAFSRHIGVSPEAVNKVSRSLAATLNVFTGPHVKSKETRAKLSKVQREMNWHLRVVSTGTL